MLSYSSMLDAWLGFLDHSGSRNSVSLGSLLLVASKVVSALLLVLFSLISAASCSCYAGWGSAFWLSACLGSTAGTWDAALSMSG